MYLKGHATIFTEIITQIIYDYYVFRVELGGYTFLACVINWGCRVNVGITGQEGSNGRMHYGKCRIYFWILTHIGDYK